MTPHPNDGPATRPLLPRRALAAAALLIGLLAALGVSAASALLPAARLPLLLALLGALIFLAVAVRFPITLVFAILLYETLLSWRDVEQIALFGFNRLPFYAVTVGTFGLALLLVVLLRGRGVRLRGVDLALGLYVGAVAVTAVTARDSGAARPAVTYLLATVSVLYTTRLAIKSERQIDQLLWFLFALMAGEALLGVAQFVTGRGVLLVSAETGGDLFRRATGTLGNGLGWYLNLGFVLVFAIWYFRRRERIGRGFLLLVALLGAGLLVANTRGAWVDAVLAVGLVVLLGLGPRLRPRRDRLLVLALLATGAVLLVALSSGLQTRVVSIWEQILAPGQSTVGFRFYVWEAALAMFRASPLVGIGPDNYRLLLPAFATPEAATFLRLELGRTYSPHHAGLHILAESGLLGAFAFALFLLAYLREAYRVLRRLRPRRPGLAAALWVFALVSTLAIFYGGYAFGGYTQVGRLYFVLVGLTLRQADLLRAPAEATP